MKFLYIDPLKQGLKLKIIVNHFPTFSQFLYIDPLKQGLKLTQSGIESIFSSVFIHRSIKTRIETDYHLAILYLHLGFYT